ncbi:hypothetical protein [Streptomyces purpureus]|nr:hypothetical protein [Streptomyces purpureus]
MMPRTRNFMICVVRATLALSVTGATIPITVQGSQQLQTTFGADVLTGSPPALCIITAVELPPAGDASLRAGLKRRPETHLTGDAIVRCPER